MVWLTRDLWKAGIAIAGLLLLLALVVWIPGPTVGAYEGTPGLATPVTATATPTIDATVTALNKEKLAQEVQQLKSQNEPTFLDWLRGNISILLLGLGALAGFLRWLADRRDAQGKELVDRKAERERRDEEQQRWLKDQEAEREKRAEERFQSAVEGLGSEREEARVGAAIILRTFLRKGYEPFYIQTFDLVVAYLRLPRTSKPLKEPNTAMPLTTLSQSLIVVFKEAFPLARDSISSNKEGAMQSLDALGVRLDKAYLVGADLERVYMREGNLREANLRKAKLGEAYLQWANLTGAVLRDANLCKADLRWSNLSEAILGADLTRAKLTGANLCKADLRWSNLSGANLREANLSGADLRGVKMNNETDLRGTKLQGAKYNTKVIHEKNAQGEPVTMEPTQWPQGFDPDGAVDVA
jgi:uncharacterized protein YjbI with pentapeptide repeats